MRSSSLILLVPLLALLLFIGCGERKQEATTDRLPENNARLAQGAGEDSAAALPKDSIDEHGKPLPPIPIEEMSREQLTEYKNLLAEKGFYSCCVEPTCRMCLFEYEECPCEHNIKKGEAVCGECYKGWQVGKGNVRGVKQKDVKKID